MIRKAIPADFDRIIEIYDAARSFMRANGNMTQWAGGYPYPEIISEDIENGDLYVLCGENGRPCAVFGLFSGDDPTYSYIEGSWGDTSPYVAIHRVASDGSERGVFRRIFEFAAEKHGHLRIDTHEDNIPMQKAVTSCGFIYRGIIYLESGSPRLAYEWVKA